MPGIQPLQRVPAELSFLSVLPFDFEFECNELEGFKDVEVEADVVDAVRRKKTWGTKAVFRDALTTDEDAVFASRL